MIYEKQYIENICLAGLNIDFYGLDMIPPRLSSVFKLGEETFFSLAAFFSYDFKGELRKQGLGESAVDNLGSLAIFLKQKEFQAYLLAVLDLFFDCDITKTTIRMSQDEFGNMKPIIEIRKDDKVLSIDQEKFEEIGFIVKIMCNSSDNDKSNAEEEKLLTTLSDKNKGILEKLLKGRQAKKDKVKKSQDQIVTLANIFNFVVNSGTFDYEKTLRMNVFQLMNTFRAMQIREDHENIKATLSNPYADKKSLKNLDTRSYFIKLASKDKTKE